MDMRSVAKASELLWCAIMLLVLMRRRACATTVSSPSQASQLGRKASFVFGDSLVEAGNNNYLPFSLSTAKNPPFGIDFPTLNANNPTGRFTNGLTIPDILVLKIGGPAFSPPFLAPTTKGAAILGGVNYASGGGGILNETGRVFIQRLSLDVQIGNFEKTRTQLVEELGGEEQARAYLSAAIFSVTMGANDFLNNFLFPLPTTRDRFLQAPTYIQKLIIRYREQLMRIYGNGARKIIVVNVPPIGCTPYQRTVRFRPTGPCPPLPNQVAQAFNIQLKSLVIELNSQLPQAHFLYADAFQASLDIITNPQAYGFEEAMKACCGGIGPNKGLIPCRRNFTVCENRDKYFFWDPYHPTQAGYQAIADDLFSGTAYTYPMNIQQLASI